MDQSNRGFFTLKWLMDSGITHYYQAANFTVIPQTVDDPNRPSDITGLPKAIHFVDASGLQCGIDSGVVYVMNDKGTTIDKLILTVREQEVAPVPLMQPVANDLNAMRAPGAKPKTRARRTN